MIWIYRFLVFSCGLVCFVCGQYEISLGRYTYFVQDSPSLFEEAERICSSDFNATLARFNDSFAYGQFIKALQQRVPREQRQAYWIGLIRFNETNFSWTDGTILKNGSFADWSASDPDNSNGRENCVTMGQPCCEVIITMLKWFDVPCNFRFIDLNNPGFICQRLSGRLVEIEQRFIATTAVTSLSSASSNFSSNSPTPYSSSLSPTATAIIAALGSLGCVVAGVVAIILIRRQQKVTRNQALNDNQTNEVNQVHVYEAVGPSEESFDKHEQNRFVQDDVDMQPAVPVDENGYLRLDVMSAGRNIPDEIEKNGNGYLKANVPAPVLDKHEYTCMNSLDVDAKAEYVNVGSKVVVGSKDHPEHS